MIKKFLQIYRFKDVIKNFVDQELTIKYKRSVLGFLWSLLNPILTMTVSSIVFGSIMRFQLKDFAVFIFSGLLPFNFFSISIENATVSIINAEGFIKKVYLPKIIFPLSGVIANFMNMFFSMTSLFIIMLFIGAKISAALLFLPVSFFLLFIITLGFSLIMSTANIYFRDLRYLINVLLSAWYYLTPILYPLDMIKNEFLLKIFKLNPLYYIIELFRAPIYKGCLPQTNFIFISIIISVISLGLGFKIFFKYEDDFIFRL